MRRALVAFVALALMVAGCGLPSDESPREYALDEIEEALWPGQLPTPTPEPAPLSGDLDDKQIHMLGPENQLKLVVRQRAETPQEILRTLVEGTFPEEAAEGVTSAINARATNMSIAAIDPALQLAIVDLAPGSLDTRDNFEQKLAFAQIVYSLTSLPEISLVGFEQSDPDLPDSAPVALAVQTDSGTQVPGTQVGRDDFTSVAPNIGAPAPVPAFDIPTPTAVPGRSVTIWKVREVLLDDTGTEVVSDSTVDGVATEPRLVGVLRQIQDPTPEAVIASLFSGTQPGERNLGLRAAFPPDAFLNGVVVTNFELSDEQTGDPDAEPEFVRIAQVDLAVGSLPSETDGIERLLAAGQMVFTLTGLDSIDGVVFLIDGEPIRMPTDNGLSNLFDPLNPVGLNRTDYVLRAPGGKLWQEILRATPTPTPTPAGTPTPGTTPDPDDGTTNDVPTEEPEPTPTPAS